MFILVLFKKWRGNNKKVERRWRGRETCSKKKTINRKLREKR